MVLKNKNMLITIFIGLAILLLYAFPYMVSSNIIFRLSSILVMALFATSFNLLLGYTGLVSFGQAAYFAIGGYSIALIMDAHSSFLLGLLGAVFFSAISALLLGFVAFRAKGIYFAILTLALGELIYQIFFQSKWSGGQNGIAGIKAPPINVGSNTFSLNGMPNYYYVVLTIVVFCLFLLWLIVKSRLGKTLISIREDSTRAAFLGVNVKRFQLIAFVISGTFTGVAGALAAPLNSIITADMASWVHSSTPIIISLLGGFTFFLGPVVGAFIYEIFRFVTSSFLDSADLLIGLLLLIVIMVLPKGVLGLIEKITNLRKKSQLKPSTEKKTTSTKELRS
jgi:branched-chain amino acid transport system permease protein